MDIMESLVRRDLVAAGIKCQIPDQRPPTEDVAMNPETKAGPACLAPNQANFAALSPLSFLARTALVYPERTGVICGANRFTWRQTAERCRRLASALAKAGIGAGDTVAALAPNVPPLLEAHFAVPMAGAVLN
ncbi:MAG: AMP-binding protein, partial [Acetobacteraceae bacterium]